MHRTASAQLEEAAAQLQTASMQDWTDLRLIMVLGQRGGLAAAGRDLGVHATTVARRLAAIETRLGARLTIRSRDGRITLTDAGRILAEHAAAMETEARRAVEALGRSTARIEATVRITAVPILTDRFLAPRLGTLLAKHPGLVVELVPEARDLSLTQREADLALRLARPVTGGTQVMARRLGNLTYGVFAAPKALRAWIGYDLSLAHLPPAAFIAAQAGTRASVVVSDANTALEAAAAGQGWAVVPTIVGAADPRLVQIRTASPPAREVWLLSHASQRGLAGIAAAADWLAGLDWGGCRAVDPD
ncbi:MAG: LysR family transcriptional regulator [Allgaiera sp.]|jgi:DNA-binding transcriptional LysR family regulator|nr:LysR family transcriptional regulator [Allgaiera sp.]